ncbi:hypothetical protein D9M68_978050 [compost metagenome]
MQAQPRRLAAGRRQRGGGVDEAQRHTQFAGGMFGGGQRAPWPLDQQRGQCLLRQACRSEQAAQAFNQVVGEFTATRQQQTWMDQQGLAFFLARHVDTQTALALGMQR